MRIRRAFFHWLMPAAFILPMWLLVGWGVSGAGGWAFLWVLFIAIPSVFIGQLLIALLVRSRPSVRVSRAVSWTDVLGIAVWHGLTVAIGFHPQHWFGLLLALATGMGLVLVWSSFRQLRRESLFRVPVGGDGPPGGVFIVTESNQGNDDRS